MFKNVSFDFFLFLKAKKSGRYDQGILDVGLTAEDHVELVRTHTFLRKHATGKAKIELHVLSVERGLSWEAAQEKWAELTGIDEGFYLANQVRYFLTIFFLMLFFHVLCVSLHVPFAC